MKRLSILLLFALLCVLPSMAGAQTSITTTTLSVAISAPNTGSQVITVASATGISVGTILYVDGSVYRVLAVSGTSVTVINTYRPATHLTSATVYVVPLAAQVGLNPIGSCIRSTAGVPPQYSPYTLMFNLITGDVARCAGTLGSRTWVLTNPYSVGSPSGAPPQTP